jgi:hypothetical protein
MDMVKLVLLANLAATFFMVGLIWFVQIVHYPLFGQVGRDRVRAGYELGSFTVDLAGCDSADAGRVDDDGDVAAGADRSG